MVNRVCVLGETLEGAVRLLEVLCEANQDDIYRRRNNVGIMNDGTELVAMSIQDSSNFYGRIFDYVFFEQGKLALYCWKYGDAIEYLQQRCMLHSTVPREFQWSEINMNI